MHGRTRWGGGLRGGKPPEAWNAEPSSLSETPPSLSLCLKSGTMAAECRWETGGQRTCLASNSCLDFPREKFHAHNHRVHQPYPSGHLPPSHQGHRGWTPGAPT